MNLSKKSIVSLASDYAKANNHDIVNFEEDGIIFFEVGKNSSHWFYLGLNREKKQNKFYYATKTYDENDAVKFSYNEIFSLPGYIGHY
ncbi:MAG: hypothetical protein LC122_13860 [Chitinophagales bacterium]|nr:hypothetical protein [Chitinophagales bacterium]